VFGSYDPTDQGYHAPGSYGGVAGTGDIGVDPLRVGGDAEIDFDGGSNSSITIPTPGGGITIPLPPDPDAGPAGLPHGTLGAGFGGAVGIGGTAYWGGTCGCNR
jgi:hypothetical protein